jgi:hypothetical protein
MKRLLLFCALWVFLFFEKGFAVPPLVADDVPPAEKGAIQWYLATLYLSGQGSIERDILTTAMSIGITDRQEISWGIPLVSTDGEHGIGDLFVGTKFLLFKETEVRPAASVSFNLTTPTGDASKGLGTGGWDYDFRCQAQKKWGWFTLIGNVGYSLLNDPERNVWFVSTAQEYEINETTRLLSEVYFQTSAEAGLPNIVAGDIGFVHSFTEKFNVHAAVGTSLREDHHSGTNLRVYVGFEWDFDAPWKRSAG